MEKDERAAISFVFFGYCGELDFTVMGVAFITLLINSGWLWAFGLLAVVVPVIYFGSRLEIEKFYLPKKRELEALRQTLVAVETPPN